jgi:protein-L-isoaspartate(D-aspartate) O-methyltransferase
MRKQLVSLLKTKGITNNQVLDVIEKVPRHLFFDNTFIERAYEDIAFPIGSGQTISRPHTVAFQTQLLELKKGDKVLEVGTGCGYQTSVLLEMGVKVFSIERQKGLFDKTKKALPALGYSTKLFYGDGYKGLPSFAPFDKIIITAGAPIIPNDLLQQLKIGGILVIPLGVDKQVMTTIVKTSETKFEKTEYEGDFKFVPMLEQKN